MDGTKRIDDGDHPALMTETQLRVLIERQRQTICVLNADLNEAISAGCAIEGQRRAESNERLAVLKALGAKIEAAAEQTERVVNERDVVILALRHLVEVCGTRFTVNRVPEQVEKFNKVLDESRELLSIIDAAQAAHKARREGRPDGDDCGDTPRTGN